jgi:hypothetical protein
MKVISLVWLVSIAIFFYCDGSLYVAAPPKVDVYFDGDQPLFYINSKLLFYASAALVLIINLLLDFIGRRSALLLPLFYKFVDGIGESGTMVVARKAANFRLKYVFRGLASVINLFLGYFLFELYVQNGGAEFQPLVDPSVFFYVILALFFLWVVFFFIQMNYLVKEIKQQDPLTA